MTKRRKLLIATSVPSTITAFLLPYAAHYRSKGWIVDGICNGGPSDETLIEALDDVFHIPWTRRPLDPVNLTVAPRRLRQLVKTEGYDLVHLHDPIPAFVGRLALKAIRPRARARVVYTAHGFHFYEGASAVRRLLFRSLEATASRWTDRLIVINREDLDATRSFPISQERVVYVPGVGVDLDVYRASATSEKQAEALRTELGLQPGDVPILMVAEFNPGKRHLDAVSALAAANREELVLLLAGVGPMVEGVREHANRLGVAERVRFLGYRRDVPALLAISAALMLPSEREGLPRSIMEASSSERPVLATRIRGITELVDSSTGVLTEVGDVPGMAEALRRFVDEPEWARSLGQAGRKAMKTFHIEGVLRMHDDIYSAVLGDDAGAASGDEG